jgi:GMP synthase (glutamine-hydrolysing)
VCLGGQLLAGALGGKVGRHSSGAIEVGYYPITSTDEGRSLFEPQMHAFQWHRDGFEVPAGGVLLAEGETFECQAFRYGDNAYGIQFHPELTPATMTKWSTHAHGRGIAGIPPTDHIQKFQRRYEPALRRWLDRFLDNWIGTGNSKSADRSAVRPRGANVGGPKV